MVLWCHIANFRSLGHIDNICKNEGGGQEVIILNPFCPIRQYSDVFSYIKLKISYLGSYNDYKTLTNQNRSLRLYSVSTNQRLLPQLFRVKWNEITMRESCAVLLGFATFFYFHQFLYLKYFFHYFDYKICLINKYSMNIHYSFSILDLYK